MAGFQTTPDRPDTDSTVLPPIQWLTRFTAMLEVLMNPSPARTWAPLLFPEIITALGYGIEGRRMLDCSRMSKAEIAGIAPFFIVRGVPAALAFYRDSLGFEVTFQGPEPDDIFFGIVNRGMAMILLKAVGVDPAPNSTRNVNQGIARWDAYVLVPDPDALAAEFLSRGVRLSEPLQDTDDGLRGFEVKDPDGYVLFFGRPLSGPAA